MTDQLVQGCTKSHVDRKSST